MLWSKCLYFECVTSKSRHYYLKISLRFLWTGILHSVSLQSKQLQFLSGLWSFSFYGDSEFSSPLKIRNPCYHSLYLNINGSLNLINCLGLPGSNPKYVYIESSKGELISPLYTCYSWFLSFLIINSKISKWTLKTIMAFWSYTSCFKILNFKKKIFYRQVQVLLLEKYSMFCF